MGVAGANFVLLAASGRQSMHGERTAMVGELAVVPPLLGSSQRLLNRDHFSVYYKVLTSRFSHASAACLTMSAKRCSQYC